MICRKATTTGDGLVAAMHVLDAIITSDKTLAELRRGMTKHPQHSINLEMKQRRDMDRIPAINRAIEECEAQLAGRGRVVLRPSGTEPVLRVMVEGEDGEQIRALCHELADKVKGVLKALNG